MPPTTSTGIAVVAFDVTELVSARREAEGASRTKDEFLAMLGHELRNPLAPILTALQLMRLRGGTALEHERTVIERQTRHLVRLVDDLLDVSRIARGKIELRRERMELADGVAKAIEMASPLLEERNHQLRDRCATRSDARRGPGAAGSDCRQPAHQRREVHRGGRPHRDPRRGRRRRARPARDRHRRRHRARDVAAHLRYVHAGDPEPRSRARRAGARPHDRSEPRPVARRQRRGAQRRPRPWQRVRHPPAGDAACSVGRGPRAMRRVLR